MNSDCSLIMEFNTATWRHQCIIKELLSILKVEGKIISPYDLVKIAEILEH